MLRTSTLALTTRFVLAFVLFLVPASARADRGLMQITLADGRILTYTFVRPDDFSPDRVYPVVLALPGGPQTRPAVNAVLAPLDGPARRRGWVIVSPEAIGNQHYFDGGEIHIPAVLDHVRSWCRVEADRFHLAGVSNGGVSAFRLAILQPERYLSLLAYPGFPPQQSDFDHLGNLKNIPIRMFVGSDDAVSWTDVARKTQAAAKKLGLDFELTIVPREPHIIASLTGDRILDILEKFRKPEATPDPDTAAVSLVLDQLHDAASKAEARRYFDLYAPEAVFIGTDASERWTLDEFRAYATPFFSKGKGWIYRLRPGSRHIAFIPPAEPGKPPAASPSVAWFDELLDNDKYGLCRGSGVLRKIDGAWKITQYHLTVPVPNDLLERVAKLIAAEEKKPRKPEKPPQPDRPAKQP